MKETVNKAVKSTNGYKTYVTAFMFLLMAVFGDKVPFLKANQEIIRTVLEYALELGVIHKLWRWLIFNWKDVKNWSKEKLMSIINKLKSKKNGRN